jgi:hypothetical protein
VAIIFHPHALQRMDERGVTKFYEHKHLEVYCIDEGEDILVITVVVKYF